MLAAPYMYSGELMSHPVAQYASSMLSRTSAAQQDTPLPSIAEIQQAFRNARQKTPSNVETEFSHAVVTTMRERMVQETMHRETTEEPDLTGSAQQDDTSDEALSDKASTESPSEEDEGDSADGSSLGASVSTGSGASWQQDEEPLKLEASLQHSWGRAKSTARALHQPINFFVQGNGEQPNADQAEDGADPSSYGDYSPYPIITTEPFSRAWRGTHQQAASMAGKLMSSVQSAADSGWGVVTHRLDQMKSAVSMSGREGASSTATSAADSSTQMTLSSTDLSSASGAKVNIPIPP